MITYRHEFSVDAPLAEVARFHQQPARVADLTPPPVIVRVHQASDCMQEGAQIDFTLWFGLLPVHWRAGFEGITANGFVDRQLQGPFQTWVHRHSYFPAPSIGKTSSSIKTVVRDEIVIELKRDLFWRTFGRLMRLSLPALFIFRAWKTRRLLEREKSL